MEQGISSRKEAAALQAKRLRENAAAVRMEAAVQRATDAGASTGDSAQRQRRAKIRRVERMIGRVARDLGALDVAIADWDGAHPSAEQLLERVESVESQLSEIEQHLCTLRDSSAPG